MACLSWTPISVGVRRTPLILQDIPLTTQDMRSVGANWYVNSHYPNEIGQIQSFRSMQLTYLLAPSKITGVGAKEV